MYKKFSTKRSACQPILRRKTNFARLIWPPFVPCSLLSPLFFPLTSFYSLTPCPIPRLPSKSHLPPPLEISSSAPTRRLLTPAPPLRVILREQRDRRIPTNEVRLSSYRPASPCHSEGATRPKNPNQRSPPLLIPSVASVSCPPLGGVGVCRLAADGRGVPQSEGVSLNRNNTPSYRRPKGGVYLMGRFSRSLRALGMRMEKKLYPSFKGSQEIFPPFIALFVFHFLSSSAKPLLNHATIAWLSFRHKKDPRLPVGLFCSLTQGEVGLPYPRPSKKRFGCVRVGRFNQPIPNQVQPYELYHPRSGCHPDR